MSGNTTIKVNNSKQTDLEFDVAIEGLSEQTNPLADVRFVVNNVNEECNLSVKCKRTENNKWLAKLPALHLEAKEQSFHIEVIVDGYYFAPATGTLILVSEPKVAMKENMSKNLTVSASFEKAKIVESEKIDLGTIQFKEDWKFGDITRAFTKVLKTSANILDNAIAKNGVIQDVNKPRVEKTIDTLQKSLVHFISLINGKKS